MNPGDASQAILLDLPVREVTLMEDRARVIRSGSVDLPAGTSTVLVEGISLLVADKTLLGRVKGVKPRGEVVSARVRREHRRIQELDDADIGLLFRRRQSQEEEHGRLTDARNQHGSDRDALAELEDRALREMSIDASWGKADREAWAGELAAIRARIDDLTAKRTECVGMLRKSQEEMDRIDRELAAAGAMTEEFKGSIEAMVEVQTPGRIDLEFEYVVPAACWRPCHVATLVESADGAEVEVRAEACVWQCTGESWDEVGLSFSTQRPSLGVEPPELVADIIEAHRKPESIVVETRERAIQDAGLGRGGESPEMPGIDDGGDVLCFKAMAPASVPSDCHPYRVGLFTMTAKARTDLVCMPELNPCAIRQSEQANTGKAPLLAGPVDLIRENARIGRTQLPFIAAGESFRLGWGPDAEIRVFRWLTEREKTSRTLSSWEEETRQVCIRLSNLGADPKTIRLSERIPVSEIEQVEVRYEPDADTPEARPDENGILTWDIPLTAWSRASCDFAVTIRKKKSVEGI